MSLADLPCRKCANCKDITVVAFPTSTPYVYIECPKLPVGHALYYPFAYECREFSPKEVQE